MHNELVDIVELTEEQEKEYALSIRQYYTAAVVILFVISYAYFMYNSFLVGAIVAIYLNYILRQTNFYTKYIVRGPHIKGTCPSCGNEIIIKKSKGYKRCKGCKQVIVINKEYTTFASDDEHDTRNIENDIIYCIVELTEEERKIYAADFEAPYLFVIMAIYAIIETIIYPHYDNFILYFTPVILVCILSSKTFYYKLVARGPYVKGACPNCASEIIIKKSRKHKQCKSCKNTIEYLHDENRFRVGV